MKLIKIALPGGDYVAGAVPWRLFKAITRLAGVSSSGIDEDDWYNIAGLVVEIFENRFGINDLKEESVAELIAVLNMVMARVRELSPKPEPKETPANPNWIVDLEISLVNRFDWSLRDIDNTDVESLLPFLARLNGGASESMVYIDQVDWL